MFQEINALVGAVAKALQTSEMEVVTAIEQGRLGLEMKADDQGRNFVEATCDDKTARIYAGAIFRPDDTPDKVRPDAAQDGGCGCGS